MGHETVSSGKEGSAITAVLAGAAGFGMSFPVGLNSVSLGALVALPLLLSMLAAKVLLYASQVAQSARRVVMHTGGLRADIDALANLLAGPLPQLPGQVMAPSVQLQVLIPLKPFVTNLAHKSIGRHQCSRRQRYHLCLWVCTKPYQHSTMGSLHLRRLLLEEEIAVHNLPGVPGRFRFRLAPPGGCPLDTVVVVVAGVAGLDVVGSCCCALLLLPSVRFPDDTLASPADAMVMLDNVISPQHQHFFLFLLLLLLFCNH
jgi:hypothetical protein